MERYTKRFTDGSYYCEAIEDVGIEGLNNPTYVGKAVDKLAAYEDAEEEGKMCILPYPIGMPIHKVCYSAEINDGFIYSTTMSLKFYADNINYFKEGLIHSDEKAAQQALLDKINGRVIKNE